MDKEFRVSITGTKKGKKAKIRNSFGVYDCYKYIMKNKWFNIGKRVTEHEFYTIVRSVNKLLAEYLAEGESILLPYKMGLLEIRRQERGTSFKDGKLKVTYPVNWNGTLELWENDEEARNEKILVRHENSCIFRIIYNKYPAVYENKTFYEFAVNRGIRIKLKENIQKGKIDTLW